MTARPQSARDQRLDVMRAVFIVSMIFGHLAKGSVASDVLHPFQWFDGAFGFVLLSGVVLGVSRRRQHARCGADAVHRWLARRALTLWVLAMAMTTAALTLKVATGAPTFMWPAVTSAGTALGELPGVLSLATQPTYLDILPTYVILLLFAQPALWLLRTNRPRHALVASSAIYVLAQLRVFDGAWGLGNAMRWPSWQLLFVGGMVVGWHWPATDAVLHRWRRHVIPAATPVALIMLIAAQGRVSWLALAYAKPGLSPPTLLGGLSVCVLLLYGVGTLRATSLRGLSLRPLVDAPAMLGRHSLGCFITLTLIHIAVLTVPRPATAAGSMRVSYALATVAACTLVALVADNRGTTRRVRQPPLGSRHRRPRAALLSRRKNATTGAGGAAA